MPGIKTSSRMRSGCVAADDAQALLSALGGQHAAVRGEQFGQYHQIFGRNVDNRIGGAVRCRHQICLPTPSHARPSMVVFTAAKIIRFAIISKRGPPVGGQASGFIGVVAPWPQHVIASLRRTWSPAGSDRG